jgi:hypothetical protein
MQAVDQKTKSTMIRVQNPTICIEKIVAGSVVAHAERSRKTGGDHCHYRGSNVDAVELSSLDEVAEFLRAIRVRVFVWSLDGARSSTISTLTEFRVRREHYK